MTTNNLHKILIVDDSEIDLEFLSYALAGIGYECITTSQATDVIDLIERENPKIVLLDINMPLIDGFELCKQIKQNPNTYQTNVIFISSSFDKNSILEGYHVGAIDYLPKSLSVVSLVQKIATRAASESIFQATSSYLNLIGRLHDKYDDSSVLLQ